MRGLDGFEIRAQNAASAEFRRVPMSLATLRLRCRQLASHPSISVDPGDMLKNFPYWVLEGHIQEKFSEIFRAILVNRSSV